jgi:SHS2 domain-containing protein
MHWEHFEHDADIGIRGIGTTPATAFAQAASALTAVVTNPEKLSERQVLTIHCSAPNLDILFLDWINELVYTMAVRRLLFRRFSIVIEDNRLTATAYGETLDPAKHHPAVEIKGATFTELSVRQRNDGQWVAQCVVDV